MTLIPTSCILPPHHTTDNQFTLIFLIGKFLKQSMVKDNFKTQPPVDRQFRLVSIVLNNNNRLEPDRTSGQPAVEFEATLTS